MYKVVTYLGILILSGMVAVQVYAGWGNHGFMKGSGRAMHRASEHGRAYHKLSYKERTDLGKPCRSLKDNRQEFVMKESVQENSTQSAQVRERDQNLKFDLNRGSAENYFSPSCGTGHPAVTGGSCHM